MVATFPMLAECVLNVFVLDCVWLRNACPTDADIKVEFQTHVTALPCLTTLVDTITAQSGWTYKSPKMSMALMYLWGVVLRLKFGSIGFSQLYGDDKVTRTSTDL